MIAGKRSGVYAPMYLYGTEMISKYYPKVGLKNKKVLTISGSGDQVINAYFFGAREVVGFDLNKLSAYIINLKFAAIKRLNYLEFLRFFGTGKNDAGLSYELYLKMIPELDKDTKRFFDAVYIRYKYDGKKMARSVLFHSRKFNVASLMEINVYLKNEHNYKKTKILINKVKFKFVRSNVLNLMSVLREKFDVINLSNVPNFVTAFSFRNKKDPVNKFYKFVILKLKNLLFQDGKLFFYLYANSNYPNKWARKIPPLNLPDELKKLKHHKDFKFKGIFGGLDKIVCLRKA